MSYRIRNWSEYNAGLKQRGSLTFWIDESVLESWIVPNLSGKPGASMTRHHLAGVIAPALPSEKVTHSRETPYSSPTQTDTNHEDDLVAFS